MQLLQLMNIKCSQPVLSRFSVKNWKQIEAAVTLWD